MNKTAYLSKPKNGTVNDDLIDLNEEINNKSTKLFDQTSFQHNWNKEVKKSNEPTHLISFSYVTFKR